MRKTGVLLLFLLIAGTTRAQLSLWAEVGGAISYIHHKNTSSSFNPGVNPTASVSLNLPITNRIALRSGIFYAPKQYRTKHLNEYDSLKFEYLTNTRVNYIAIPFLLSVKTINTHNHSIWIDAGMNYSLFISGHSDYEYNTYVNGTRTSHSAFSNKIVGRYGTSRYGATVNSYDMDGLDVSFKLQARYTYKEKYSVQLFYEHSLYDFRANPDEINSTMKLRNAGISLGYRLF